MVMRLARTVAEPTAKNGFLFTILGSKWGFLWLWLLIINVLALLAYGLDKLLAKLKEHAPKTRRIPEKTLLLLAALGGGIGAWLGMELFRHKTQHRSFRICILLIICVAIRICFHLILAADCLLQTSYTFVRIKSFFHFPQSVKQFLL